MTSGTLRIVLLVETLSFVLASLIHSGLIVPGYQHPQARTAEGIIAAVLLLGLVWGGLRPASLRKAALTVQWFALLGTVIGIFTIAVGVGPRTAPDLGYHITMVVALIGGLQLAGKIQA